MDTGRGTPERVGANASIEHDRIRLERFRAEFPRAMGLRGERVVGGRQDGHADAKGHDAYLFDLIETLYL